ncbi:MAG: N-6 DNA methylase, partial [Pseudanabaena sp. M114S2SP2A07QC]|nr:N-6 DNA methylase [Pseudanabaena sp. M114S2SP2A07QC]
MTTTQIAKNSTGLHIEGNLIAGDYLADLVTGSIKGQAPEDFGFAKADKLADEIATVWGEAKKFWAGFKKSLEESSFSESGTTETRKAWVVPLLYNLGYLPTFRGEAEVIDGQSFAISHRAGDWSGEVAKATTTVTPPIHITGCRIRLDQKPPSGNPRLSAHGLMQEYLNRTEHLWGITTNGLQWRLLRDSSLMTRLTYIEFDLDQILEGENFAEFGLFYRLFHRSRLPIGMDDAHECLLEFYHQETLQQGGRVRDRLRDGVERAIAQLGNGFLQHPKNQALRDKFAAKEISDRDFYRQILLLIYRLLFLMVAESRNLLLTGEDPEKVRIYEEYYSIERLRALAEKAIVPRREGFQDLWQGLRVTFCLFDENWRGELLGLSPLNGDLFGSTTLPELNTSALDNYDLMVVIRNLSLYAPTDKAQLRRVNYAALDVEELGSVYESLLDFHPQVSLSQGKYEFLLVAGSDRKTTGAYYTPSELVAQLVKSALEPVIAERMKDTDDLQKALLSIKVCDPACGSGHFLLAAARRIGKELAKVRTGEAAPSPEPLREATRDVIQHCIYGVDINPLAVDLCKVALWIEGFAKGMPLNFLDHRIKCGNSLVGVLNLDVLKEGIPDEAFKAVTGDDKALSSIKKKANKQERLKDLKGQLSTAGQLDDDLAEIASAWQELDRIPENTPEFVKQKKERYEANQRDRKWWRSRSACNLWTAAFFMPLTEQNLQLLPTTAALVRLLNEDLNSPSGSGIGVRDIVDAANQLASEKGFFHWALEFPDVFENDGFDCILG